MIATAAGLLLAGALAAPEPARVAVLVGNDVGLGGEQALRFTGADARRLGAVLVELGGFDPANVHVLELGRPVYSRGASGDSCIFEVADGQRCGLRRDSAIPSGRRAR